jgi:SAM-dependent methyltransferase
MKNRYAVEATFYDLLYDPTDDIPLYLEYASKAGGSILECACGTGRLLLPLARAGHDVTGLDSNDEMLRVLRAKLRKEDLATRKRVHLVRGDMRKFKLPGKFAMALIGFASFLHNVSIEDEEECVRCVAEHLQLNGRFIVDVFNPDLTRPQQLLRLDKVKERGNQIVLRFTAQEMNFKNQTMNCTNIYDFVHASGAVKRKVVNYQLRYLFKDELVRMLERTGYRIDAVYGSVDREPFTEKSGRIVCIASKLN